MAKLKAPDNSSGLSHDGVEYEVKKGYITVPDDNALILAAISHGFTTTGEVDEETAAAQAAIEAQARAAQAEADAAAAHAATIAAQAAEQAAAVAAAEAEAAAKAAQG